jgi:branched-chain amino acid transport system substrate-binding protein
VTARARTIAGLGFTIALAAGAAAADVRIAFIDPLSGGAASTGILAQKTHQFYIDAINAAGGINGEKIELLSYDNKVNPQESLIQLKKAIDEGARYVVQGNGSSVALAITDAVLKHNERNPGKEIVFLNYAAVDPALTNEKCNFWHFRFDADADMKMAAMTDTIAKDAKIKRVYLINQDYSFGKAVAAAANKMLARSAPTSRSSATSCTRCRRSTTSRRTSRRSRRRAPTR